MGIGLRSGQRAAESIRQATAYLLDGLHVYTAERGWLRWVRWLLQRMPNNRKAARAPGHFRRSLHACAARRHASANGVILGDNRRPWGGVGRSRYSWRP